MSDFFQDNHVTTFHKLADMMTLEKLEEDLRNFTPNRPVALLIPSLYSELEGEALPGIIAELKKADYITPVPGGVGPVTVACAIENMIKAFDLGRIFSRIKK